MSSKPLCTFYKNIVERSSNGGLLTAGKNVPLFDLLTNERYTNGKLLNDLRNSGYKSVYYESNKRKLSAACFSSVQDDLRIDRSDKNHLFHTGYIAFDIDTDDNPYLLTDGDGIREAIIENIPNVVYLGKSVSNLGYWGLFRIYDKEDHYGHFRAMQNTFEGIDVHLDKKVHDLSRLRFVAYDPDGYINEDAPVFTETVLHDEAISKLPYYERKNVPDAFYLAACKWVEAKHDIQFKQGSIHNYLLYLYSLLRSSHVSRENCLNWIYNNLIDEVNVTTNCLDEPKWYK